MCVKHLCCLCASQTLPGLEEAASLATKELHATQAPPSLSIAQHTLHPTQQRDVPACSSDSISGNGCTAGAGDGEDAMSGVHQAAKMVTSLAGQVCEATMVVFKLATMVVFKSATMVLFKLASMYFLSWP